ncbi:hypothetical protein KAU11_04955 [Candidatus Babeliales bacterium]|nr:hypothetical protein [Candidatus Babeliales bacterium]
MKAVSNTSPIFYLWQINQEHLLPTIFGEVAIPEAVQEELSHPVVPDKLRSWIKEPPAWLKVQKVTSTFELKEDPILSNLHAGEREAIISYSPTIFRRILLL